MHALTFLLVAQSLFPIDTPFGFGKDGTIEIGVAGFLTKPLSGYGKVAPDLKEMGFFITMAEAQTMLEYDLSQVQAIALLCLEECFPSLHLVTAVVLTSTVVMTGRPIFCYAGHLSSES
jgi:hypothetical protein